ncbi:MAG: type II secretion system major pseudopilin GspG [Candidatus Omnitrophica bacterium]|nr:type II secretion system major pseudopilin GspG [Candidatus Omnitrophota bacterium]
MAGGGAKGRHEPGDMKVPRHLIDIDLMLLVIVIGSVASVIVPKMLSPADPVKVKWAEGDIRSGLPAALESFRRDNGDFPSTWQGLDALVKPPAGGPGSGKSWNGPYVNRPEAVLDPWGSPYVYVYPGIKNTGGYDLASLGADRKAGRDDIKNWGF